MPQPNMRELSWQRHMAMAAGTRLGQAQRDEVRPIYWANRPASYTSRTRDWDEYPNGRWGDARSPAYGELSHYYLEYKKPKVDRQALWGVPSKPEDVYDTFVRFLDGRVATLPWCEQAPAPETSAIASSLKLLNANGYLTINSQVRACVFVWLVWLVWLVGWLSGRMGMWARLLVGSRRNIRKRKPE
jgi:methylenetetrahydrofolate reductase (NADPH)